MYEKCYLNENYVLLYKIINWWNDNSSDNEQYICGDKLRCKFIQKTRVKYNPKKRIVTISSNYQELDLISLLREEKSHKGSAQLTCTYINKKYFGQITPKNAILINSDINSIEISNVVQEKARRMLEIEKKIIFELRGTVHGLLKESGKIALHHSGSFYRNCRNVKKSEVVLTISNQNSNEVILEFKTI